MHREYMPAAEGGAAGSPSRSRSPSPASSRCRWVVSSGSSSEVYGGKAVASDSRAVVVAASKGPAPEGTSGGSFQRVGTESFGYSVGRKTPTGMGGPMRLQVTVTAQHIPGLQLPARSPQGG